MIQRSQSLWLLLSGVFAFLTMRFPFFFTGPHTELASDRFTATNKIVLLIFTAILGTLCLVNIFVYKNRKQQLWLTIVAFAISILNIILFYNFRRDYTVGGGGLALTSIFGFAIPVFLFWAARNIYRDQKLVKSMNKLR